MSVIGIIPARYQSSRFPGKPLADIGGKTMIQRVWEQSCKAELEQVIIATDDERIKNHATNFGAEVVMTSAKHKSGTERVAEAAKAYNAKHVINIQGDEPFIHPEQITQLAELLEAEHEITTLVQCIQDEKELFDPHIPKVVLDNQGKALYFSRQAIPYTNASDKAFSSHTFYKHIGLYGYQKSILEEIVQLAESSLEKLEQLEQLRWLQHGYSIQTGLTELNSYSIDVPADLDRLKALGKLDG